MPVRSSFQLSADAWSVLLKAEHLCAISVLERIREERSYPSCKTLKTQWPPTCSLVRLPWVFLLSWLHSPRRLYLFEVGLFGLVSSLLLYFIHKTKQIRQNINTSILLWPLEIPIDLSLQLATMFYPMLLASWLPWRIISRLTTGDPSLECDL